MTLNVKCSIPCLVLVTALASGVGARAEVVFPTYSIATQTLTSPLFGESDVQIRAVGTQRITLDLASGTAGVTSLFRGDDLPDPLAPGAFLEYDLYNTTTSGTVSQNPDGTFDVAFSLLFELRITSGLFSGLIFETLDFTTFSAQGIPTIPYPPNTLFLSPDPVAIYVKSDPTGTFQVGDLVGFSSGRVVDVVQVIPEPSSLALCLLGACGLGLARQHRRRLRRIPTPA